MKNFTRNLSLVLAMMFTLNVSAQDFATKIKNTTWTFGLGYQIGVDG